MEQNSLENLSPEAKLISLGVSPEIAADKIAKLKNSPDLSTLRENVRKTGLNVSQFLSLLFQYLFPQTQVKQRVAEKLKKFNLTPEMLDYLFIYSAGEPYILFFNNENESEYNVSLEMRRKTIPSEMLDEFKQTVNDIMLQELRSYLF